MTTADQRSAAEGDNPITRRYDGLVRSGTIAADADQRVVVRRLDRLSEEITRKRMARKSSALGWLFAKGQTKEAIRGLYVHGGVGRGKTMLMDLFFHACQADRKRRAHFNDFMADVHDRIGRHRAALKAGETKEEDPIPPVARSIAAESWVLCFDEFTVTDIADAMILSRLFTALFAEGVVLVATSNVAPDDLYRDGLNRQYFAPFIPVLKKHCDVLALDHETDYRMLKFAGMPVYLTPLGAQAKDAMDRDWQLICDGRPEMPVTLTVKGRAVEIPRSCGRAARTTFAQLCEAPLAARDYLAIAEAFDTLMVEDIPVMGDADRNAAKRFILLIDTLYDRHVRLICSAEAEPDALHAGTKGTEAFEFARTASRLNEMRAEGWGTGRS